MSMPFPGMDPYLEDDRYWPAFQHQLVHTLFQMLMPGLLERYRARVNQRHYVSEQALFTSIVREEHTEAFLEVRQRSDGRLITLVDVISPANKTTPQGRQAYLQRRKEAKEQRVNLVELDLVLQGPPLLDQLREELPNWDYAVLVSRWTQPDRYEVYSATLPKRLPRFRVPLAADDRDTVLDLQTAVARAYDQGDFAAKLDYTRPPATRLSDENRAWLEQHLRDDK
jgi:hypothetical protein